MRWKIPIQDDHFPHQIRLTTNSWKLYVSCNCLKRGKQYEPIQEFEPGINDPRLIHRKWHKEQGIELHY